jgi:hypothetical protein
LYVLHVRRLALAVAAAVVAGAERGERGYPALEHAQQRAAVV